VIVWFPDKFACPEEETVRWLDDWVEQGGRTLIFVGRDYDATEDYWDKVKASYSPAQRQQVQSRIRAQSPFTQFMRDVDDTKECMWFSIESQPQESITQLNGPWSEGVDASKAELCLGDRLIPPDDAEVLLALKGTNPAPLVSRSTYTWYG